MHAPSNPTPRHHCNTTLCCFHTMLPILPKIYNIDHRVGDKLLKNPVPIVDGYMEVPDEPGLGVEINEKILANAEVL